MKTEEIHKLRTWLCSVVFVDICKYSKQSVDAQMAWKTRFMDYVAEAVAETPEADRVMLDTGDGAAICFLGDPEAAMFCALKLLDAMLHEEPKQANPMQSRIGVNLGSVKLVTNIIGNLNPVGDGINVAQRVMSFAGENRILVSRSFYEVVSVISDSYPQLFRFEGVRKDKHVREHTLYNLVPPGTGTVVAEVEPEELAGPVRFDEAVIERIESFLTPLLGPIAQRAVRAAAARATTPMELHRALTGSIADKRDREAFLRFCVEAFREGRSVAAVAEVVERKMVTPAVTLEKAAPGWDVAWLETVREQLALYMGPMARVLVSRAAEAAPTMEALCERLAGQIPCEGDRERFLRAIGVGLVRR